MPLSALTPAPVRMKTRLVGEIASINAIPMLPSRLIGSGANCRQRQRGFLSGQHRRGASQTELERAAVLEWGATATHFLGPRGPKVPNSCNLEHGTSHDLTCRKFDGQFRHRTTPDPLNMLSKFLVVREVAPISREKTSGQKISDDLSSGTSAYSSKALTMPSHSASSGSRQTGLPARRYQ